MALLLGLIAAVFIGLSDIGGRRVSVASSPATAATASNVFGGIAALAATGLLGGALTNADTIRGLVSGLGLGTGLMLYYVALPRVGATLAAPILGTLTAVIPYTYAVVTGTVPSGLAFLGAGLALAGIIVITTGSAQRRVRFDLAGLGFAVAAGLAYAAGIIAVIDVSDEAGTWPAVFQKVSALGLSVAYCAYRSLPTMPPRGTRRDAIKSGVAAGLASCAYVSGLAADPTPAIVTASMFPAFSVAVGRGFFGDAISRRQLAGIVCALAGITAVAIS